ncbi:MAG: DUF2892 domain-containing protein [Thermoflexales bacterium]|nr:DUF2892 domain-containing protein [Thermoflexales bacterium]
MKFVKFMTSGMGRGARIVLGIVILSVGLLVVQGTPGLIMAVVALIPIAGGVFDYCLVGAALGYPFWGAEARKKLAGQ